jgi:hypothetical protein
LRSFIRQDFPFSDGNIVVVLFWNDTEAPGHLTGDRRSIVVYGENAINHPDGLEHRLFVVLKHKCQDIDHLTITVGFWGDAIVEACAANARTSYSSSAQKLGIVSGIGIFFVAHPLLKDDL